MVPHMRLPGNLFAVWIACLLAGAGALFGETRVVVENEAVRILAATQAPGMDNRRNRRHKITADSACMSRLTT